MNSQLVFLSTIDLDLDVQSQASYGHDPHTQTQFQKSVGSKDRVETNGRTDRRTLPIALPFQLKR